MRPILALSIVLSGLAGPAFAVEDRYGPPRAAEAGSAAQAQRLLNWHGKSAAPDYEASQLPPPIAPWAQRRSAAAAQPAPTALPAPPDRPQPIVRPVATAPAPAAPATPVAAPLLAAAAPAPVAQPATAAFDPARLPPPVSPWNERGGRAAPRGGEAVTLGEQTLGGGMAKAAPGNADIPVTQTKQNAAATRNSSIDF